MLSRPGLVRLARIAVFGFGAGVVFATAPAHALSPPSKCFEGAVRTYRVVAVVNEEGEDRSAPYAEHFGSEVEITAEGGLARHLVLGGWCHLD